MEGVRTNGEKEAKEEDKAHADKRSGQRSTESDRKEEKISDRER
jgi:hypothetical protein